MSRELILKMSMSIDGFVAGPNGEIDWIFRSSSEASTASLVELLSSAGVHAMGHRTYHDMASFWPTSTHPVARAMNEIPKVVFSRSGRISRGGETTTALKDATSADGVGKGQVDPAVLNSWMNPRVMGTDLVADIERLKQEDGKPIIAHGGAGFATSLIAAGLVDQYRLVVHPIALGRGLSIFGGLEQPRDFQLEELKQYPTGVVVKTYRPA
jgi:dihydrofolate reductase